MSDISIVEAVRDDSAARRYLKSVAEDGELPEALLSPRKWVQAIYLTKAGRLPVAPRHLARLLDVSCVVAEEVRQRIARMRAIISVALSVSLCLLGEFLQVVGIGLDTGFVGVA
jgi:hypothetical protein